MEFLRDALARISSLPGMEWRPAQCAYAEAAAKVFNEGGIAFLEAAAGTGKTYGYLVPLLLALGEGKGRAVVATRTRALQEQLWRRDLPALTRTLGLDLSTALLKGRENYLCLRRLEEAKLLLLPRDLLVPLLAWADRTEGGDLDELPFEGRRLLPDLRDIPYRCGGSACPFFSQCLSRRARERARKAQLVVANHALVGADLAAQGRLLGPYTLLVVDEAHAFASALRDALSLSLSPVKLSELLGELRQWGKVEDSALDRIASAHHALWAALPLGEEPGRLRPTDVAKASAPGEELIRSLEELARGLSTLRLPDEDMERAKALAAEAIRLSELVRVFLRPEGDEMVFWYARERNTLSLYATPMELGEVLAELLWPRLRGAVLTSATLAVGGSVASLSRELGISPDSILFRRWPSPFSYERVRAFILRFLPHPDDPEYPAAVGEVLRAALAAAPRRALALFTANRLLQATLAQLGDMPALAQGRDGEREQLLTRFREHPPPVLLLGLETMWEGIDLPREELELLFITRLPFPVPTDPVAQAQAERLEARGGDPFWELSLPKAVLKLRQGVGRLVRTPQDRGAIIITDPRAATQSYRDSFLRELPGHSRVVHSLDELTVALQELFR